MCHIGQVSSHSDDVRDDFEDGFGVVIMRGSMVSLVSSRSSFSSSVVMMEEEEEEEEVGVW